MYIWWLPKMVEPRSHPFLKGFPLQTSFWGSHIFENLHISFLKKNCDPSRTLSQAALSGLEAEMTFALGKQGLCRHG